MSIFNFNNYKSHLQLKVFEMSNIIKNIKSDVQILKNNTWDQNTISSIEKLLDRLESINLDIVEEKVTSSWKSKY